MRYGGDSLENNENRELQNSQKSQIREGVWLYYYKWYVVVILIIYPFKNVFDLCHAGLGAQYLYQLRLDQQIQKGET